MKKLVNIGFGGVSAVSRQDGWRQFFGIAKNAVFAFCLALACPVSSSAGELTITKNSTHITEGDKKEYFGRIYFHSFLDKQKTEKKTKKIPGGFLDQLSLSNMPGAVFFRAEHATMKPGRYLWEIHLYDPEGRRVRKSDSTLNLRGDEGARWWKRWKTENLITHAGDWRVDVMITDEDKDYLVMSRILPVLN